ncbi:hemerythrin domain-containing protein [Bacteroidales bacterium OttesenSCG-928-A17]|nr:hemerythrin domain-containing protein [Bacteroidales bacterium OttesenSCG-928-A17]
MYQSNDQMSSLVSNNFRILLVISRFGIPLGFGDKTIGEVCGANGVDTNTFLAVVNRVIGDTTTNSTYSLSKISIEALITYLHNSHDYFLKYRLPGIRQNLLKVLDGKDELTKAVLTYFDEYVKEVGTHMNYEEKKVFSYVRLLLDGKHPGKYTIEKYQKTHDQVETPLREFKQILIKYYPAKSSNDLNSVLFDIFNCENDLASHTDIEDNLFTPLIFELEQKVLGQ